MTAPVLHLPAPVASIEWVDGRAHRIEYRTWGGSRWRRCASCLDRTTGVWASRRGRVLHAGDGPTAAIAAAAFEEEK